MAASITQNTVVVNFASIFAMPNKSMQAMFRDIEHSGLRSFLGCSYKYSDTLLKEFFESVHMKNGEIIYVVQNKKLMFTQKMFAELFSLPTEGVTDFSTMPNGSIDIYHSTFSDTDSPITHPTCQKRDIKIEFRLLADIVAKGLLAKAGAYDKITLEKFLVMAIISSKLRVNWSDVLFKILVAMINKENQSQGFAVQICHMLTDVGVQPVDMIDVGKTKLFTWVSVDKFIKKNGPTDEVLVLIKTEAGEEFVKQKM